MVFVMRPRKAGIARVADAKAGFTLIEMLMVVLIIGILVGIAFTGTSYVFGMLDTKQAKKDLEELRLALEEFKTEHGDYPGTRELTEEFAQSQRLYQALAGYVDRTGKSQEGKSFLKGEGITLGRRGEGGVEPIDLDADALAAGLAMQVFPIDPWGRPYVYEYPRRDGRPGFLLFSKGEDMEASVLPCRTQKKPIDEDNLPASEPGGW